MPDAVSSQPPGLPSTDSALDDVHRTPDDSPLDEIYHSITKSTVPTGMRSNRVLVLFSGPYNRPDGLGVFLSRLGLGLCAGTARLWNVRSLRSDHAPCGFVRGTREASYPGSRLACAAHAGSPEVHHGCSRSRRRPLGLESEMERF